MEGRASGPALLFAFACTADGVLFCSSSSIVLFPLVVYKGRSSSFKERGHTPKPKVVVLLGLGQQSDHGSWQNGLRARCPSMHEAPKD